MLALSFMVLAYAGGVVFAKALKAFHAKITKGQ
jgi:hypothetical protein